MHELLNAFL